MGFNVKVMGYIFFRFIYVYILYNYTWSFFIPHLMGISGVVWFFTLYPQMAFFCREKDDQKNWKKRGLADFQTNSGEPRAVSSYHEKMVLNPPIFWYFCVFCWGKPGVLNKNCQPEIHFLRSQRIKPCCAPRNFYQYDSALKMHKKHQESTRKWWVANMKICDDDSHHEWWWLDLWKHPRYTGENWWMKRWNWWNYLCSFLCGYNLSIIYLRVGGTLIDVLAMLIYLVPF